MKVNPQRWQKNQDALLRVRDGTFQAFMYVILAVYIVGYLVLAPLMIQSNQISIIVALTSILVVIGVSDIL